MSPQDLHSFSRQAGSWFMVQTFSRLKYRGRFRLSAGPVRAVFGGRFAGRLLSERAACGLGVWLWPWARAASCWRVWLVAGCPVGCLASGLAVVGCVRRQFGSCGWAAGVHAFETRLEPITPEAWLGLDLVSIDDCFASLGCWLVPARWWRVRFAFRDWRRRTRGQGPWAWPAAWARQASAVVTVDVI